MAHQRKLAIRRLLSAQLVKGQSVGREPLPHLAQHVVELGFRLCSKVPWFFKLRAQFVVGEEAQLEIRAIHAMGGELIQ